MTFSENTRVRRLPRWWLSADHLDHLYHLDHIDNIDHPGPLTDQKIDQDRCRIRIVYFVLFVSMRLLFISNELQKANLHFVHVVKYLVTPRSRQFVNVVIRLIQISNA